MDGERRQREEDAPMRDSYARPFHALGRDFPLNPGLAWIGVRPIPTYGQPNVNLDLVWDHHALGPHFTRGVVLDRIHVNTPASKRGLTAIYIYII